MPDRSQQSPTGLRFCRLLCLTLALSPAGRAQTGSAPSQPAPASSDALTFLTQVVETYAQATSYRVESVAETRMTSEFYRSWERIYTTAIVGANNQYRFELRSDTASGIQVSDGKTEWIYYPPLHQYIQQLTPATGPSPVRSKAATGLAPLLGAQGAAKAFLRLLNLVSTAAFAPDETIVIDGKSFACVVVQTEGELPGKLLHVTQRNTFWIDKQTHVIRKFTERSVGPLHPSRPDVDYELVREEVFTVAELGETSFPDGVFTFKPPVTAVLVKNFEDPQSAGVRELVGKQAPAVRFKTADGKEISLQSFQGKPVLLDFWATWCRPCVESLPVLEKLHGEMAEKGFALISVDEDEQLQKAAAFWTVHKEQWPNYHASGELLKEFPDHGIPYFVLIDSAGKIVFSQAGLDESALRSALTRLAPTLATTP
jgi:thiol-disulfide isomerase/thioredoxin/outer membrane lipoprotein-sorting protein